KQIVDACLAEPRLFMESYLYVENKEDGEVPFKLRTDQLMVYDLLQKLRQAGKAQRLVILKARQVGICLDPKTRVLTADLRWVNIESLRPGDEVVSVDEFPPGGRGPGRKMRRATVVESNEVFKPAFK